MFAIPCVKAVRGDERAAIVFNACLLRLMQRRKQQLAAEGGDESSLVAWKMATFQQDILHRVVMLGQGASNGWNDCNLLSSVLCARALLETVANMNHIVTELTANRTKMELEAVSDLLDKQLFATRNKDWLKDDAGYRADLAKMINGLDLARRRGDQTALRFCLRFVPSKLFRSALSFCYSRFTTKNDAVFRIKEPQ
jgi:hypothetical protein